MSHAITRRELLGAAAAAGGTLLAAHLASRPAFAAEEAAWPKLPLPPVKIYKVYAGRTGQFYMARPTEEIAKFEKYFADLEQKLGNVKFIGGDQIPPTDVAQVAAKMAEADAAILIHLSGHGGDAPVLGKLIAVGLPTAVFAEPFGGHGWMYFPQWHKDRKKVVLLPTTDWAEIDRVVGLMRVPVWLRQTRILSVGTPKGTAAACSAEAIKKLLGAELVVIPNTRIMEAMQAVDPKAAEAEAEDYWISQAKEIIEPKRQEIIETSTSPIACRTQFTTQVKDARRMFLNWGADVIQGDVMTLLHRVVFYGDYMQPVADLADLMGLKVIEEGGPAVAG